MYVFMLFQLIISPSWPFAVLFSASLGRERVGGEGRNHHHHDDDDHRHHHPLGGTNTQSWRFFNARGGLRGMSREEEYSAAAITGTLPSPV